MSFLRADALRRLARWHEAAIGAALAALGLYWFATIPGLMRWGALALAALGAALAWTGAQRARFHHGRGGLGVVQVDERQIIYLAPVGGGFASLDALSRVEIAPDRAGLPVWRFASPDGVLTIPTNAEGSENLFDALAALPGANLEAAIRASRARPDAPVLVWSAPDRPRPAPIPGIPPRLPPRLP